MKQASLVIFLFFAVSTIALMLVLSGCGGTSNSMAVTQGNWAITATSAQTSEVVVFGGNLSQSGSNLAGSMYPISSLCFAPSEKLNFTGTVKGSQVTLTSAADSKGQVITVVANGTGSSLTGSYSVTGGSCANGDHGTVSANPVPSISGTWSGPVVTSSDPTAVLTIALTQASTPSPDGTFAITGTLTYQNSICEASGTIDATSASLFGPSLSFTANTISGDTIYYTGGMLDSTSNPKNINTGVYEMNSVDCGDELADPNPTFTKQ